MSPHSPKIAMVAGITIFTVIANLPFGYLRQGVKKFSFSWFLYIHITIPAVVALRLYYGLDYHLIPLFVVAAITGQVVGGRLRVPKSPQD